MTPIPAIDENGDFVEVTLGSERVCVMGYDDAYVILMDGGMPWRCRVENLSDWPAVRERVERARGERERVAREDAKRLEAFGVEDRTDAGVKVTYSPSGAASVDSRELFEKVIEPLLAESQRRQAIRAHAGVDEPRTPSFAEALEAELRAQLAPEANMFVPEVQRHLALCDAIKRARAASGE